MQPITVAMGPAVRCLKPRTCVAQHTHCTPPHMRLVADGPPGLPPTLHLPSTAGKRPLAGVRERRRSAGAPGSRRAQWRVVPRPRTRPTSALPRRGYDGRASGASPANGFSQILWKWCIDGRAPGLRCSRLSTGPRSTSVRFAVAALRLHSHGSGRSPSSCAITCSGGGRWAMGGAAMGRDAVQEGAVAVATSVQQRRARRRGDSLHAGVHESRGVLMGLMHEDSHGGAHGEST